MFVNPGYFRQSQQAKTKYLLFISWFWFDQNMTRPTRVCWEERSGATYASAATATATATNKKGYATATSTGINKTFQLTWSCTTAGPTGHTATAAEKKWLCLHKELNRTKIIILFSCHFELHSSLYTCSWFNGIIDEENSQTPRLEGDVILFSALTSM